jgi:hypothetical protein
MRLGEVLKSGPRVTSSAVLAGEIWAMLALASTGATDWATLELSVPITPATSASEASLLAAFAPVAGSAVSSSAAITTL